LPDPKEIPVAFVRGVLFVAMSVIGGYLGSYVETLYERIPAVKQAFVDRPGLGPVSQAGFVVIGVLVGFYTYSKLVDYLGDLAKRLREMPPTEKIALCVGAVVGLVITFLLSPVLTQFNDPLLRGVIGVSMALVMVFLTTQGAMSMREELWKLFPSAAAAPADDKLGLIQPKLLDTNIIIDGRIADICRAGFIEGTIYVPGFVLDELQLIADSSDALKRARGRRGLDILNGMQKELSLVVRSYDHMAGKEEQHEPVDSRLVRLAKAVSGTIVTNDFNLNKVAELQGVRVLNVNELANALKPVVLPGEEMRVHVIKEGKEQGQGIGYLDDGTMVVVEHARYHVGETVDVAVSSVLQTVAGKMIFAELKDSSLTEGDVMERNLRSYSRGQRRTGGRGQ
jgi:uncharacterized protein YacL